MIEITARSPGQVDVTVAGGLSECDVEALRGFSSIRLFLEDSKGWNGEGLERSLSLGERIEALVVSSGSPLDVSSISGLPALKSLALDGRVKGRLELSEMESLYGLGMYAKGGRVTLRGIPASLKVVAGSLDQRTCDAIVDSVRLDALTLVDCRVGSFRSDAALGNIKYVRLMRMPAITDAGPLLAGRVEIFKASGCARLRIPAQQRSGAALRGFTMDNCERIESLASLENAQGLLSVSLRGSTRVSDGKVAGFSRRPSLRNFVVTNGAGHDSEGLVLPCDQELERSLACELERRASIFPRSPIVGAAEAD